VTPDGLRAQIDRLIRDVEDFPKPGIVFKDISPLLADHDGFAAVVSGLAAIALDEAGEPRVDKVLGIEARGFILAAPVALQLRTGFVAVRKAGKLPGATHQVSYSLEYGEAVLEMHRDAISPGDRVLVVDDVLATGGTVNATKQLVAAAGGEVLAVSVLMDLSFLPGREALGDTPLHSLHTV
jgi:adenine phosphoribosyltransferase